MEKLSIWKIIFGPLSLRGGADCEILIEQFMLYDNCIFPGRLSTDLVFDLIDQTQTTLSHTCKILN